MLCHLKRYLHNVSIAHCFNKDEHETHCGTGQTVLLVLDSKLEMVRVRIWDDGTGYRLVQAGYAQTLPPVSIRVVVSGFRFEEGI